MPSAFQTLDFKISNFNRVAATLGGFLSVFGLVSYLLKEKFYLGEACESVLPTVRGYGTLQYHRVPHNSSRLADRFH